MMIDNLSNWNHNTLSVVAPDAQTPCLMEAFRYLKTLYADSRCNSFGDACIDSNIERQN